MSFKKFLRFLRKYFVIFLTVFSYIGFLYYFFVPTYWLMSSVFALIFFIFLHYFFIELKWYSVVYLIWIIVLSIILELFFIWFSNILKVLALVSFNLWLIFLILNLDDQVNNRKIISSWWIFTSWVSLFSLFLALSYSFMFLAKYNKFNLNCDILYKSVSNFVDSLSKPLKLSAEEVNNLKNKILSFKQTKVRDIILWSGEINLPVKLLSWNAGKIQESWILWKLEKLKYRILDTTLKDKRSVDQWVCNFLIKQIKERYNKPSFKFSVIILITLLLWPFLRFVLFIVGVINFIFFKILNLVGIYKFVKRVEEVEEIE